MSQNEYGALIEEILDAVTDEIEYQNALGGDRTDGSSKTLADYMVMANVYAEESCLLWVKFAGDHRALCAFRKVAAIAYRALRLEQDEETLRQFSHNVIPQRAYLWKSYTTAQCAGILKNQTGVILSHLDSHFPSIGPSLALDLMTSAFAAMIVCGIVTRKKEEEVKEYEASLDHVVRTFGKRPTSDVH